MGHSPCEFMHNLYIGEIYRPGAWPGATFAAGSIFTYFYTASPEKTKAFWVVQSHSRSSKLVPIENRYAISY